METFEKILSAIIFGSCTVVSIFMMVEAFEQDLWLLVGLFVASGVTSMLVLINHLE